MAKSTKIAARRRHEQAAHMAVKKAAEAAIEAVWAEAHAENEARDREVAARAEEARAARYVAAHMRRRYGAAARPSAPRALGGALTAAEQAARLAALRSAQAAA